MGKEWGPNAEDGPWPVAKVPSRSGVFVLKALRRRRLRVTVCPMCASLVVADGAERHEQQHVVEGPAA